METSQEERQSLDDSFRHRGSERIYTQSFVRGGRRKDRPERGNRFGGLRRDEWSGNERGDDGGSRTIQVSTRFIGRIVGRGGLKIRQLEGDSGARIKILRNGDDASETEILLSGNDEQTEEACRLINELTIESNYDSSRSDSKRRPFPKRRSPVNNDEQSNWSNNGYSETTNATVNWNDELNPWGTEETTQNGWSDTNATTPGWLDENFQPTPAETNDLTQEGEQKPQVDWSQVIKNSDRAEAEHLKSLPPIVKNLYIEDPEIANMSTSEVIEFRLNKMNISVGRLFVSDDMANEPIPNPVKTFQQAFGSFPDIMKTIENQKFIEPTPIQCQSWPVIMKGEDMIGIAQTGTGKTLAFMLPAFIHIENQTVPRDRRNGPTVLILSPTRELAIQIEKEIEKYSYKDINCVCVYGGGGSRNRQINLLHSDRPEIVVATPGRLNDLHAEGEILFDSVSYIVLDEADKMLEMGFEDQIKKILLDIRADRQTIMTSATWPVGVRRLAAQYTVNPVQVVIGSLDLTAVHSVSQTIEIIDEERKRERLDEFIRSMGPEDKVIVFCGKKVVTSDIASHLSLRGMAVQCLHGDREQIDRIQALDDLKTGTVRILIATDVAARGLDIVDITHIFNFDFPKNIEEYVHRIGRTGRAGRTGHSISLFTRRDWANAKDLIKILEEAKQNIPPELYSMAEGHDDMMKRRNEMRGDKKSSSYGGGGGGGQYYGNRSGGNYRGRGGSNYRGRDDYNRSDSGYNRSDRGRSSYNRSDRGRSDYNRSDSGRNNYNRSGGNERY